MKAFVRIFISKKTGKKMAVLIVKGITKEHFVCWDSAVIMDLIDMTPSQLMDANIGDYPIT